VRPQSIYRSLKNRFIHFIARPQFIRWAAPIRTFLQCCGWRPRKVSVKEARRILVIRPDEIGDVTLTSAFFRELRRAAPRSVITLVVKKACYDVIEHCPHVDFKYALNFAAHSDDDHYRLRLCRDACLLRWEKIGLAGFDLVLLPRRGVDWYESVLIGHLLAGYGALMAHDDKIATKPAKGPIAPPVAFDLFSNPHTEHEVIHNLRFLSACGAEMPVDSHLETWPVDADLAFADDWLARNLPSDAPLVVFHPSGGNSPLKQWPKEKFRDLLDRLLAATNCNFLIIGGSGEEWIARDFVMDGNARVIVGVGKFRLRQLAAIMKRSNLFVGGDSGPMHIAAASGTRVLAVFGSTSEKCFRPWGTHCRVVSLHYECSPDVLGVSLDRCQSCRFEEPRCLTELPVSTVLAGALELLMEQPTLAPTGQCAFPSTEIPRRR
jgi:ADP-heptose:LPS heptosyltransferase